MIGSAVGEISRTVPARLDARIAEKLHVDAASPPVVRIVASGTWKTASRVPSCATRTCHLSPADDLSYFTSDSGNDACGICLQDAVIKIGLRYPQARLCRIYATCAISPGRSLHRKPDGWMCRG